MSCKSITLKLSWQVAFLYNADFLASTFIDFTVQCDKTFGLIKEYTMKLHNFVICLLFGVILADDALEDVQTEFYLPYSATEDVDFSLSKPSGFGCYQW